jgi:two-component system, chemotaxis family, protein-glutamate methylesterase/glutaminase
MTGMGDDGAVGLLELRRQGGYTFGQDEASCAVFGMPQAAQRLGAVTESLPLGELAAAVVRTVAAMRPARATRS